MRLSWLAAVLLVVMAGTAIGASADEFLTRPSKISLNRGLLNCTANVPISCGQLFSGNTVMGFSSVVYYPNCGNGPYYTGEEVVHEVVIMHPGADLQVSLVSDNCATMDLFLLQDCDENSCLTWGDTSFSYTCAPGTYYVVVDSVNQFDCLYDLNIACITMTPTPPLPTYTPTRTPTPSLTPTVTRTPTTAATATPQPLLRALTNIDLYNHSVNQVNNFELDMHQTTLIPYDIRDFYEGPNSWGNPPIIAEIPLVNILETAWLDYWNPIAIGDSKTVGLDIDVSISHPPYETTGSWSVDQRIAEIPIPWQGWSVVDDTTIRAAMHFTSECYSTPVEVTRYYCISTASYALNDLQWNLGVTWQQIDATPVTITPGDLLEHDVTILSTTEAVLFKYSVTHPVHGEFAYIVSEAVLNRAVVPPTIVESRLTFAPANVSGAAVSNVELALYGNLQPTYILEYYSGDDAWGLPGRAQNISTIIGDGIEVTWLDSFTPLNPLAQARFGMSFVTGVTITDACFMWSVMTKELTPLAWTIWNSLPEGRVRAVVYYSDDYTSDIQITREIAKMPAMILLDDLSWDSPGITWSPVFGDPVTLTPGSSVDRSIWVYSQDAVVLLRYTVQDSTGRILLNRVVSEVVLSEVIVPTPTATPQPIPTSGTSGILVMIAMFSILMGISLKRFWIR